MISKHLLQLLQFQLCIDPRGRQMAFILTFWRIVWISSSRIDNEIHKWQNSIVHFSLTRSCTYLIWWYVAVANELDFVERRTEELLISPNSSELHVCLDMGNGRHTFTFSIYTDQTHIIGLPITCKIARQHLYYCVCLCCDFCNRHRVWLWLNKQWLSFTSHGIRRLTLYGMHLWVGESVCDCESVCACLNAIKCFEQVKWNSNIRSVYIYINLHTINILHYMVSIHTTW